LPPLLRLAPGGRSERDAQRAPTTPAAGTGKPSTSSPQRLRPKGRAGAGGDLRPRREGSRRQEPVRPVPLPSASISPETAWSRLLINYRLSPRVQATRARQDVAALAWAAAVRSYGATPDRIVPVRAQRGGISYSLIAADPGYLSDRS